MKFNFKKKDRKLFAIIFILIIIFVVLTILDYDLNKDPTRYQIEEGDKVEKTTQAMVTNSFVRFKNLDLLFTKLENSDYAYQVKDKMETYIKDNKQDKVWNISEVDKTDEQSKVILNGDILKEELIFTFDDKVNLTSVLCNGEELMTEEIEDEINDDPLFVIYD